MECLYWMTGEHDGLVIFDAPDVVSAGAASAGVTSSGLITSKLQQLLDMDEAAALLDKARAVVAGYQQPQGAETRVGSGSVCSAHGPPSRVLGLR